ncbi:hypothetical protein [Petroclostridium xylanilyticum]|uniref:hypothetical protein n=1 Tax=Petroclostridium xylanilyticum TaxID=1792311 RepID=UPI000B98962F|nr:hypothetical protein [Petroclostridium xylanilyticum]
MVYFIIILFVISVLIVYIYFINILLKLYKKTADKYESLSFIYEAYYNVTSLWIRNKNKNKNIEAYLANKGIKYIAVYGAGKLGELLYEELKNASLVKIKYIIDRNTVNDKFGNLPVINIDQIDLMDKIDAIVVTPIYVYEDIKNFLIDKGIKIVLCIDDIIYDIAGL